MVRDYETPTVPRSWDGFAREWADRLGLREKKLALVCSPDRYGNAVVLRITTDAGSEITYARRSSDADDAAERREGFLAATASDGVREIEIDVAGYYVGEGTVPCAYCGGAPHEEWQHILVRELLRVAEPPAVDESLPAEDADDAEQSLLDAKVGELLGK
ncbi:MAG TPA: hypothetical protein VFZ25_04910 [Chloroflexota bacterium]|nr:hypothetical protein [Chloroflexota bacterium]